MEQYEDALRRVRQCEEQYKRESLLIDSICSTSDNDGMPHGSGISKPTEEKAVRLAEKGMDLFEARKEALRLQREIFEIAYKVGGVESDVLVERYINLRDWSKIYAIINYSDSQTYRYHISGLDKVADILGYEEQ